jgi:hypothetical protein
MIMFAIKDKFNDKFWDIHTNEWQADKYSASATKSELTDFVAFYNEFGGDFYSKFEIVAVDIDAHKRRINAKEILGIPLTEEEMAHKRGDKSEQTRTITRT